MKIENLPTLNATFAFYAEETNSLFISYTEGELERDIFLDQHQIFCTIMNLGYQYNPKTKRVIIPQMDMNIGIAKFIEDCDIDELNELLAAAMSVIQ